MPPLLQVRDLTTRFNTERGPVTAVDRVSFDIDAGETVAIVGESGSGKSVTALSLMRLIPSPPGRIESGEAIFEGEDLFRLDDAGIRRIRGNRIAMIFQEPMSSLNPALTVGVQVAEPARLHRGLPWTRALELAKELLGRVRIPDAASRLASYPHQYSGGMRQRVMIAMALSLPAAADHRGRADHRARRDGAGADPRSAEGAHARDRFVAAADHP